MEQKNATRENLIKYVQQYREIEITDIFKYLFQSSFGCEHLVVSEELAKDYLEKEYTEFDVSRTKLPLVERLDGEYSRVSLEYVDRGISIDTFAKLFCLSAKKEDDGRQALEEKLCIASEMCKIGELPFDYEVFSASCGEWRAKGYPAVHHSENFRRAYSPAYRLISNRFIPFLPVFAEIDKKKKNNRFLLAVEGGSASGKTTFSELLKSVYGCTVFHTDDFFLQRHQRTSERFAEPGGNMDRERFLEEVLIPLTKNEKVILRRFDCMTFSILPGEDIIPTPFTVVEGAYSMHPDLADKYDLSVFLDVSEGDRKKRIQKRNSPELAKRFFNEWIPLETLYFNHFNIKEKCDITVKIEE